MTWPRRSAARQPRRAAAARDDTAAQAWREWTAQLRSAEALGAGLTHPTLGLPVYLHTVAVWRRDAHRLLVHLRVADEEELSWYRHVCERSGLLREDDHGRPWLTGRAFAVLGALEPR